MTQTPTNQDYATAARAAAIDVKMYEAKRERILEELRECERMLALWQSAAVDLELKALGCRCKNADACEVCS